MKREKSYEKTFRTSITDPLRINDIRVGHGRLGITFCPGKCSASLYGASWRRDLQTDVQALKDWGADMVITLLEDHEFEALEVPDLGQVISEAGIEWLHLPIRDVSVPDQRFEDRWKKHGPAVHALLDRGGSVVVHCRGGLGRAGTVGALALIERGWSAGEAISQVRIARPHAIETREQERWLEKRGSRNELEEQILALLLGGAVGDYLGSEVEFLSLTEIRDRHPDGIEDLPREHDGQSPITDDTQMTLFTAEGLHMSAKTGHDPVEEVHLALLRWLETQEFASPLPVCREGLICDSRLHVRRAPGNTCLSSLRTATSLGMPATNDSKGCGTIMRVAPIAFHGSGREEVRKLALRTSALTHGHPTGQLAAAAWAEMLHLVAGGLDPEYAARTVAADYRQIPQAEETVAAINAALTAPRDARAETVESLGGGWIAEEALAIALYSCLATNSFEDGLRVAVTHSGDSDSTGAIAGNMLGLMYPREVLSHSWTRTVECPDLLVHMAEGLL